MSHVFELIFNTEIVCFLQVLYANVNESLVKYSSKQKLILAL